MDESVDRVPALRQRGRMLPETWSSEPVGTLPVILETASIVRKLIA